MQAWERSNLYYKSKYRYERTTRCQIKYIQNLFSPCCKLMKTRLEGGVAATYHLWDGTPEGVANHAEGLLRHGFHAIQDELGQILYFWHPFIEKALALLVFWGPKDLGLMFNAYFNPIPPEMIAFMCAMQVYLRQTYKQVDLPSNSQTELQHVPQKPLTPLSCEPGPALRDNLLDDPDDVLPVDAFDTAPPAKQYVPQYKPKDVQLALKKVESKTYLRSFKGDSRVFSDDENNFTLGYFEQNKEHLHEESEEAEFGQPGPGLATLAHRARPSQHHEFKDGYSTNGPESDPGSETELRPSKHGKGIARIQDSENESGEDGYYD
ncbi:hypothetical protein FRC12_001022 [Ceratobasidium sp. 428]|nr:hypothetical protein FRC12_001022 [Ceratobasidium sp. 428]